MKTDIVVNNKNISRLIQKTLNFVDPRLVDHGKRVAGLVHFLIETQGGYSEKEKQDIYFLALLHDIGAYKTEEINEMAKFEANDIWEHSIYGYLFLKHFSPLNNLAEVILYHHASVEELEGVDRKTAQIAQIINLADRADMFMLHHHADEQALETYLKSVRGSRFSESTVDLYFKSCRKGLSGDMWFKESDFQNILPNIVLTAEECESYLKMMIYAIDFRSQHTVTHTITTTSISRSTAQFMGMSQEQVHNIYCGAVLHDLGKIGIPVEILEYPGKLSPQAMKVMRTHVNITEEILGGTIDPVITNIALRHHEKLDGSGYPRGLGKEDLTLEEQVVAVSDIVSALLGTRSYKEAYSKEKTLSILEEQAKDGKISSEIVSVLKNNFDSILAEVKERCTPILNTYYGLQSEYNTLLAKFQ